MIKSPLVKGHFYVVTYQQDTLQHAAEAQTAEGPTQAVLYHNTFKEFRAV